MKILMVNKFLYPRGGAETYMLRMGEYLSSEGHEVQYFGMYDEQNTVGNRAGLYTSNMDFHTKSASRFLYPTKLIYSGEAYDKISRVADDFKPDIVHFQNVNYQLSPSVIDAIYEKKIPMVMTVHDFQMVCPNHMLYSPKYERICEKCIGHGTFSCIKDKCIHLSTAKSAIGAIETLVYRRRKTYGKVDLYICPSEFIRGKLELGNPKVFRGKTKVMCNFVKLPDPSLIVRGEKDPYVVYAGRLSKEKGIEVLAEAAKLLPDVRFVIAGTGPEAARLDGLPNADMRGFIPIDELYRVMAHAKMLVLPSICYENCPLSILEAQSVGTPVVTASVGGMAELVRDGVTGAHVAPMTGERLAEVISGLLSDPERLDAMAQNCVKKREEIPTLPDYCENMTKIYESVIAGRQGK